MVCPSSQTPVVDQSRGAEERQGGDHEVISLDKHIDRKEGKLARLADQHSFPRPASDELCSPSLLSTSWREEVSIGPKRA